MTQNDAELLRLYAADHSQDAFAELVRRHVDLVYSVAVRKTGGNAHMAEDVTQRVFVDLARKAESLADHPVLAGWLFKSTHFAACALVRAEARRRKIESNVDVMTQLHPESDQSVDWEALRHVVDDAVNQLSEHDRAAVLLRFFKGLDFAQVGSELNLSSTGARSRVERALDKLNANLSQRGINSTAGALALALTAHATTAAPAAVAATAVHAAISTAGAGAAVGVATLFMSSVKIQVGIAAVALASATTVIVTQQKRETVRARQQLSALHAEATKDDLPPALAWPEVRTDTVGVSTERVSSPVPASVGIGAGNTLVTPGAGRTSERIYKGSEVDKNPAVAYWPPLRYPEEFIGSGERVTALVSFVVNARGEPTEIEATAPHAAFRQAAIEAIREMRWEPAEKAGNFVSIRLKLPLTFEDPKKDDAVHKK